MKILVLGGTSAVACDFLSALSRDTSLEVFATYCKTKPYFLYENIRWFKLCLERDEKYFLSELEAIEFDYVLNFILLGEVTKVDDYYRIMSKLFLSVFGASTRVINISSNGVYKHSLIPITELDELNTVEVYAKQKVICEKILAERQMNLRVAILPISRFGSGTLMKNIYKSKKGAHIFVNENNSWNGILSKHFAQLLITLINQNYFIHGTRNIFSLNPEPTIELIKAILLFTDRNDLEIYYDNSKSLNKITLSTVYKDFHNNIWHDSIYGGEITTRTVLDELSKLRFHLQ